MHKYYEGLPQSCLNQKSNTNHNFFFNVAQLISLLHDFPIVNFPFYNRYIHVSAACWIYIFYNILELRLQIAYSKIPMNKTLTLLTKRCTVVIKNWSNITFSFLNYLHPCSWRNYLHNEHCRFWTKYYYTFRSFRNHSRVVLSFVLLFSSNFTFHWPFVAYPDAVVCTGPCSYYLKSHLSCFSIKLLFVFWCL